MIERHFAIAWPTKTITDRSLGLVVMGGDSCPEGCGFESKQHILDGIYPIYLVVKFIMGFFRKTKNKQKRGWDGQLKTKKNYYSGFDPFSFHRNLTLGLSLCTFRCWARPSWCWSFWPSRTRRTWRFPDILLRSSSGSGFVQSTSASAWTPDVP